MSRMPTTKNQDPKYGTFFHEAAVSEAQVLRPNVPTTASKQTELLATGTGMDGRLCKPSPELAGKSSGGVAEPGRRWPKVHRAADRPSWLRGFVASWLRGFQLASRLDFFVEAKVQKLPRL